MVLLYPFVSVCLEVVSDITIPPIDKLNRTDIIIPPLDKLNRTDIIIPYLNKLNRTDIIMFVKGWYYYVRSIQLV
jgi:hypothetical protein